eukprot:TRINITY_DN69973_c0_g1_i1.p1 TRINITY_DN69973_c0_g1~~TRINITY_DN69973_c0_g1_i1.p1  ORF type:complete len:359 (+),score=31.72 TRINITY_DN69973_c0_g1_i1:29-1078(+)
MPSKKEAKTMTGGGADREDSDTDSKDHAAPRGACLLAIKRSCRDGQSRIIVIVDRSMRFLRILMNILGPCLMCLALSLIGYCTYAFFVHLLPAYVDVIGLSGQAFLGIIGLFLESNTVYNYYKAAFTDPGDPPEFDEVTHGAQADGGETADSTKRNHKQCSRCTRLKPPRCHHCSMCNRCVLKMDHHCPWIHNCAGHGNYRYFCLFLLFLSLVSLFGVVVFSYPFIQVVFFRRSLGRFSREGRRYIMNGFMICASILVALTFLGGFHVYAVLTNQTTIEFQLNLLKRRSARTNGELFRNPYDLGRTRNFQQVFGTSPFCGFRWMLPWCLPAGSQPVGDGMSYPSTYMTQ